MQTVPRTRIVIAILLTGITVVGTAHAQVESVQDRQTLRGLRAVTVNVSVLLAPFDQATLQSAVELRIRQAGISVVEERSADVGRLDIAVTRDISEMVLGPSSGLDNRAGSFRIDAQLIQRVRLVRLNAVTFEAPTWTAAHVARWNVDPAGSGRRAAIEIAETFINAFLAANAK